MCAQSAARERGLSAPGDSIDKGVPGRGGSRGEETVAGEGRALVRSIPARCGVRRYNHLVLARSQIQEVFPLAACPRLAENSRLGFGPVASTSQWGSGFSISSNTLGLSGTLYDGRVRSRSTGKERDSESGNDYFGARYYASSMGRWLMPDPSGLSYSDPRDPQSLNLYAYVGNHALTYVDPYGLSWFTQSRCTGVTSPNGSLGGRIRMFIANLFTSCGGGGGGGGSNPDQFPNTGWPVTKRPFRQLLTQMDVAERVYDVKQNLSKPCKRAYSGVGKRLGVPFSMSTFARSLENGELDQHPNEEPEKYSSANATTDSSGARTIHTWANFYGESSGTQGFILWHELTHKNFRIGDDESNAPGPGQDFNNQFAPYGYGGDYNGGGTAAFTDWLEQGCPAQ